MITQKLQFAMLIAMAVYFVLLILLLKRKRLLLKYSLLWIFAGLLMLILAVFPGILHAFSRLLGIFDPVNALFAIIFFCVIIMLVALTSIVSAQNEKIKRLVQNQSILEEKIREMDKEAKKDDL